ncbi:MAG TPA: cytochrome c biogenesis protein CcsA [Kofleriaceae bacterium]|nr:cytochrome c biogenesis protein CcsA [Kofleriaceae bacterium]
MKRLVVPGFLLLSAIGFAWSTWIVFTRTPLSVNFNPDGSLIGTSLFYNQKIFYYHVPHAFMLFLGVGIGGVCSIVYLVKRWAKWDDVAIASIEVAAAFGAAVLVTGSIWAKAAWDVWWNAEPRLTLSLLLWLILMGYVIVRRFAGPSADRIAAGMAIFGMVGVPFIYKMVGQDSHPAAGSQGVVATLLPGMRGPFWLSVVTFFCWYIALVVYRVQGTRAEREVRELRERGLDLGVLS